MSEQLVLWTRKQLWGKTQPRGICVVCDRNVAVSARTGRIGRHKYRPYSGYAREFDCPGRGFAPK